MWGVQEWVCWFERVSWREGGGDNGPKWRNQSKEEEDQSTNIRS